MEFMFSNATSKHHKGHFSDNFVESLEKLFSRVIVTKCFGTCENFILNFWYF